MDRRIQLAPSVPGLFALYDPDDKPAGWYLRSIQRAGASHGIPVYARSFSEGVQRPREPLGGMIVLSKTPEPIPIPDELDADILKYPHHGVAKAGWNYLKHISPELAVITNGRYNVKNTRKDAEKRGIDLLYTTDGAVRLRTDGIVWVVDQLPLDESK
jgi:hypothetical protein